MPLDYSIDPANRLVVVRGADSVTGEPHIFDRIVQDPRFERGFNFIRDRRELTEPPESDDIRQAVAIMKAVAPRMAPCRWAVVVPAENLVFYGMARMASLLMDDSGIEFGAFLSYDSAVDWAMGRRPAE
jgi:hypothetical protein